MTVRKTVVACLAIATCASCQPASTASRAPGASASPTPPTVRSGVSSPPAPTALVVTPAPVQPQGGAEPQAAPAQTALTLTGALAGHISQTTADACGAASAGFYANLTFELEGSRYVLTLAIPDFKGPGTYSAPPARISIHRSQSLDPSLYGGSVGTVTVSDDQRSGTVKEHLVSQGGQAELSGAWRC